ncbi:MAG: zinc ribbon domain-containing protein [Spirochaetaceae bacterium]|nr:MAG: zinc ribbon domain-containing protein [Spirochaetaceae bacterium]
MPTYDYECRACGHSFDVFQNMSDKPLAVCPACSKRQLRRLIGGGAGIIFKGSGFYVNDSRSKSSAATASSGSNGKEAAGAAKSGDTGSGSDSKSDSGTRSSSEAATPRKSAAAAK